LRLRASSAACSPESTTASRQPWTSLGQLFSGTLEIEQEKYNVGLSTNYLIHQYQSYVAQARSTEVAARGMYVKAREALERAIGETLENHNISIDDTYRGPVY